MNAIDWCKTCGVPVVSITRNGVHKPHGSDVAVTSTWIGGKCRYCKKPYQSEWKKPTDILTVNSSYAMVGSNSRF